MLFPAFDVWIGICIINLKISWLLDWLYSLIFPVIIVLSTKSYFWSSVIQYTWKLQMSFTPQHKRKYIRLHFQYNSICWTGDFSLIFICLPPLKSGIIVVSREKQEFWLPSLTVIHFCIDDCYEKKKSTLIHICMISGLGEVINVVEKSYQEIIIIVF